MSGIHRNQLVPGVDYSIDLGPLVSEPKSPFNRPETLHGHGVNWEQYLMGLPFISAPMSNPVNPVISTVVPFRLRRPQQFTQAGLGQTPAQNPPSGFSSSNPRPAWSAAAKMASSPGACGRPTMSRWDQKPSDLASAAASSSYRTPTWTATSGAAVATGKPAVDQDLDPEFAREMCLRPKARPVASPDSTTEVSSEDEEEDENCTC